jgi:hypothetical protein
MSLNSSNVFIVVTPDGKAFVWHGRFCNKFERAFATVVLATSSLKKNKDVRDVEEGHEPNEFWEAIGGKQAYSTQ